MRDVESHRCSNVTACRFCFESAVLGEDKVKDDQHAENHICERRRLRYQFRDVPPIGFGVRE